MNATSLTSGPAAVTSSRDRIGARASLAVAFAIGASLIFLVGFAQSQTLHDAAHDTRHTQNFPCH